MSMPKIAVLGCGPAGLLAAHAAHRAGIRPAIFSRAVPSSIGGAQYLHCAIPEVTSQTPDGTVMYQKNGSAAGYARKVYGDTNAETSWKEYEGEHEIWNMRMAYNNLWHRYESCIVDQEIDAERLESLQRQYDLIISSIPAPVLCLHPNRHIFRAQQVGIVYREMPAKDQHEGDLNLIVYDGRPETPWYRSSYIFGWLGDEYPPGASPTHAVMVNKPLWTDCDCHAEVVRVGRYGRYEKRALIHHAFAQVEAILASTD